jgi:hypothetical protein
MVIARADDPDLEAGSLTKRFPQPPCTSSSRPLDTSDSVIKRRSGPFRIDGDYAKDTFVNLCAGSLFVPCNYAAYHEQPEVTSLFGRIVKAFFNFVHKLSIDVESLRGPA